MAKIKITENELKALVKESVEKVLNEGYQKNPGFEDYSVKPGLYQSGYRKNPGAEGVTPANQAYEKYNQVSQELAVSQDNSQKLRDKVERLQGELNLIAQKLGVEYSASPKPIKEAAQKPQVTGVQAILGAIKNLQASRNQLAKTNKELLAQVNSLKQRISTPTLKAPEAPAVQNLNQNALAQAPQGGLAPLKPNTAQA